jgi:hypothetical protein
MQRTSQFFSVLFHPLFMPLYATWLLFHAGSHLSYTIPDTLKLFLYALMFVMTAVLPASIIWFLWQRGWIESPELNAREERHIPFLLTLACYGGALWILLNLPVSRLLGLSLLGACIAVLLALLINLRWKISIHMIGIGGLAGLFYGFGYWLRLDVAGMIPAMCLAAGITGTARLIRKAHTPAQVYAGFLLGFVAEFAFSWLIWIQYART